MKDINMNTDELIIQQGVEIKHMKETLDKTATKEELNTSKEISSLKVWFAGTTLTIVLAVIGVGYYVSNQLLAIQVQLEHVKLEK